MGKLGARCALIFAGVAMIGFMIFAMIDDPAGVVSFVLIIGGIKLLVYGLYYGLPWIFKKAEWE